MCVPVPVPVPVLQIAMLYAEQRRSFPWRDTYSFRIGCATLLFAPPRIILRPSHLHCTYFSTTFYDPSSQGCTRFRIIPLDRLPPSVQFQGHHLSCPLCMLKSTKSSILPFACLEVALFLAILSLRTISSANALMQVQFANLAHLGSNQQFPGSQIPGLRKQGFPVAAVSKT